MKGKLISLAFLTLAEEEEGENNVGKTILGL